MAYWEHPEQRLFWEMNVSGLRILVRSGAMGHEGELRTMDFMRDAALQTAFKRIAKEKEAEGYRAGTAPAERNLALEDAILRDPDDERAFLVYADWLQGRGDPRGEFISVQHAIAHAEPGPVRVARGPAPPDPAAKGRERLEERANDLETLHLARLPWGDPFRYRWRMGFLDSVEMYTSRLKTAEITTRLGDVLSSPAAPFVRAMSFISHHPDTDFDSPLAALAERRLVRALLALTVSGRHGPGATLRNVTVIAQAWPQLRSLAMHDLDVDLGELEFPELRALRFHPGPLRPAHLVSLATARWPKLESADLHFGAGEGRARMSDFQEILGGLGDAPLRSLILEVPFADALTRSLPGSRLVKSLESLHLSVPDLGHEGAQRLIARRAELPRLLSVDCGYHGDVATRAALAVAEIPVRPLPKE